MKTLKNITKNKLTFVVPEQREHSQSSCVVKSGETVLETLHGDMIYVEYLWVFEKQETKLKYTEGSELFKWFKNHPEKVFFCTKENPPKLAKLEHLFLGTDKVKAGLWKRSPFDRSKFYLIQSFQTQLYVEQGELIQQALKHSKGVKYFRHSTISYQDSEIRNFIGAEAGVNVDPCIQLALLALTGGTVPTAEGNFSIEKKRIQQRSLIEKNDDEFMPGIEGEQYNDPETIDSNPVSEALNKMPKLKQVLEDNFQDQRAKVRKLKFSTLSYVTDMEKKAAELALSISCNDFASAFAGVSAGYEKTKNEQLTFTVEIEFWDDKERIKMIPWENVSMNSDHTKEIENIYERLNVVRKSADKTPYRVHVLGAQGTGKSSFIDTVRISFHSKIGHNYEEIPKFSPLQIRKSGSRTRRIGDKHGTFFGDKGSVVSVNVSVLPKDAPDNLKLFLTDTEGLKFKDGLISENALEKEFGKWRENVKTDEDGTYNIKQGGFTNMMWSFTPFAESLIPHAHIVVMDLDRLVQRMKKVYTIPDKVEVIPKGWDRKLDTFTYHYDDELPRELSVKNNDWDDKNKGFLKESVDIINAEIDVAVSIVRKLMKAKSSYLIVLNKKDLVENRYKDESAAVISEAKLWLANLIHDNDFTCGSWEGDDEEEKYEEIEKDISHSLKVGYHKDANLSNFIVDNMSVFQCFKRLRNNNHLWLAQAGRSAENERLKTLANDTLSILCNVIR